MLYEDSARSPRTAEEYERRAYEATSFTAEDARRILAAHGVRGRSKMRAAEAVETARGQWPDDVREVRAARVVRYRWPVAHGLGLTYTELAEVERRAGVEPLPSPGRRGSYASAADVEAIYAAAAKGIGDTASVRVRVSCGGQGGEAAAREVYDLLSELLMCGEPAAYDYRDGGRALYFDVLVPIDGKDG